MNVLLEIDGVLIVEKDLEFSVDVSGLEFVLECILELFVLLGTKTEPKLDLCNSKEGWLGGPAELLLSNSGFVILGSDAKVELFVSVFKLNGLLSDVKAFSFISGENGVAKGDLTKTLLVVGFF